MAVLNRYCVKGSNRNWFEQTEVDLEKRIADYHSQLPREEATSIGMAYARFSSRYTDSFSKQVD